MTKKKKQTKASSSERNEMTPAQLLNEALFEMTSNKLDERQLSETLRSLQGNKFAEQFFGFLFSKKPRGCRISGIRREKIMKEEFTGKWPPGEYDDMRKWKYNSAHRWHDKDFAIYMLFGEDICGYPPDLRNHLVSAFNKNNTFGVTEEMLEKNLPAAGVTVNFKRQLPYRIYDRESLKDGIRSFPVAIGLRADDSIIYTLIHDEKRGELSCYDHSGKVSTPAEIARHSCCLMDIVVELQIGLQLDPLKGFHGIRVEVDSGSGKIYLIDAIIEPNARKPCKRGLFERRAALTRALEVIPMSNDSMVEIATLHFASNLEEVQRICDAYQIFSSQKEGFLYFMNAAADSRPFGFHIQLGLAQKAYCPILETLHPEGKNKVTGVKVIIDGEGYWVNDIEHSARTYLEKHGAGNVLGLIFYAVRDEKVVNPRLMSVKDAASQF